MTSSSKPLVLFLGCTIPARAQNFEMSARKVAATLGIEFGDVAEFGCCDALINGAGGNRKGACVAADADFTGLSLDELDKVFELNYKGTVLPSQVFCRYFATRGKGIIINTSSMSALAPLTPISTA